MPDSKASKLDALTSKKCENHKMIILGDENVGKTSLFMRYEYYDV